MLIDPYALQYDLDRLEEIEKATLRLVAQAVYEYREVAAEIFEIEGDLVADIGEDITREALDRLGTSKIDQRLFGKIDYKRARYVFHPDYAIKQALFVDSKAEQVSGAGTATLQTSQISLSVRQVRSGAEVSVPGKLPPVVAIRDEPYLTTTIFVKYNYADMATSKQLVSITLAALPNGWLQDRYNPTAAGTIWLVGRNAPTRGEEFRVRLSFAALRAKAAWRVQTIPRSPGPFTWSGG
jgi:hypothetical protein